MLFRRWSACTVTVFVCLCCHLSLCHVLDVFDMCLDLNVCFILFCMFSILSCYGLINHSGQTDHSVWVFTGTFLLCWECNACLSMCQFWREVKSGYPESMFGPGLALRPSMDFRTGLVPVAHFCIGSWATWAKQWRHQPKWWRHITFRLVLGPGWWFHVGTHLSVLS